MHAMSEEGTDVNKLIENIFNSAVKVLEDTMPGSKVELDKRMMTIKFHMKELNVDNILAIAMIARRPGADIVIKRSGTGVTTIVKLSAMNFDSEQV